MTEAKLNSEGRSVFRLAGLISVQTTTSTTRGGRIQFQLHQAEGESLDSRAARVGSIQERERCPACLSR